ncbi:stage II sporulation protein M [Nanoarchaeota archaeon]
MKKINIKKQYKKAFTFIKKSKNFIYTIIAIFCAFTLIGFFIPIPDQLSNQILELLRQILEQTKDMTSKQLTSFIFFNNLKSSIFGMILGIFFGIFPIFASLVNGYLLGFVASLSVKSEGVLSLWRILPHGIFELPAVFISLGLGLKIGSFIFQKQKIKSLKHFLTNSLRVFLLIVIPLLIIAAIIEGILISLVR